jgi:hypothetical protein
VIDHDGTAAIHLDAATVGCCRRVSRALYNAATANALG